MAAGSFGPNGMVVPSGTLPSNPTKGQLFYDDATDKTLVYTASGWRPVQADAPSSYSIAMLLVAGGASGSVRDGGGSGAGGLIYQSSVSITKNSNYSITIGGGGAAWVNSVPSVYGNNGSNSTAFGYTAVGGGGGATPGNRGASGGSGGGDGGGTLNAGGGIPTAGQGNYGGQNTLGSTAPWTGAGGGGAGAAGQNVTVNETGGNGGIGAAYSITGTSVYYAGGGGGPGTNYCGTGGNGGGGAAASGGSATNGTVNTGGGGGSNRQSGGTSGAGGSGVCIVRVPTAYYSGTTTGSPTITTDGNYTVITFTQSGSYTG